MDNTLTGFATDLAETLGADEGWRQEPYAYGHRLVTNLNDGTRLILARQYGKPDAATVVITDANTYEGRQVLVPLADVNAAVATLRAEALA